MRCTERAGGTHERRTEHAHKDLWGLMGAITQAKMPLDFNFKLSSAPELKAY